MTFFVTKKVLIHNDLRDSKIHDIMKISDNEFISISESTINSPQHYKHCIWKRKDAKSAFICIQMISCYRFFKISAMSKNMFVSVDDAEYVKLWVRKNESGNFVCKTYLHIDNYILYINCLSDKEFCIWYEISGGGSHIQVIKLKKDYSFKRKNVKMPLDDYYYNPDILTIESITKNEFIMIYDSGSCGEKAVFFYRDKKTGDFVYNYNWLGSFITDTARLVKLSSNELVILKYNNIHVLKRKKPGERFQCIQEINHGDYIQIYYCSLHSFILLRTTGIGENNIDIWKRKNEYAEFKCEQTIRKPMFLVNSICPLNENEFLSIDIKGTVSLWSDECVEKWNARKFILYTLVSLSRRRKQNL